MTRMAVGLAIAGVCLLAQWCVAADAPRRDQLGREVKLRILVDKVMTPTVGWHTEEWVVKETADAGFNVYSPRLGHDNLEEVALVTQWCEKYGIYHMPWMRGTLEAPKGPEADGKRMLWAIGEQPLWSPNSDEFWEWTTKYIVEYARMSAENPHIMGVFLDYENYAQGPRLNNLYGLSYDDIIMGKFAAHKGIELPELGPTERKPWLDEEGLHEEFEAFEIAHWRERCRTLREAVDEHDPTFVFCIYPAPGPPFMLEAACKEWGTENTPVIMADPAVYGRPSRLTPQADALQSNREKLKRAMATTAETGANFIYSGGIDPVVTGADPEFCAKNALMISEVTGGYWVFYEGPKYDTTHPEYFKWFKWANDALDAGQLTKYTEPRVTPEGLVNLIPDAEATVARLAPPPITGEVIEYPQELVRGDHVLVVATEPGQQVEIGLQNFKLGSYTDKLVWDLRDLQMNRIDAGVIALQEKGTVTFTAGDDGMYIMGVSAGLNSFGLMSANTPTAFLAWDRTHLIGHTERLYFSVPEGIEQFTLPIAGGSGETVRLNVFDTEGELVATGQTSSGKSRAKVEVNVGERAAGTWALELTKADEGALEDTRVYLDPALPPSLSLDPAHVFGAAGE